MERHPPDEVVPALCRWQRLPHAQQPAVLQRPPLQLPGVQLHTNKEGAGEGVKA
jgi:hypothetical protein